MDSNKRTDILNLIRTVLKINIEDNIINLKEFQEFLQLPRITYLKISYLPKSNKLLLSNSESKPQVISERELCLIFYKNSDKEIEINNFFDEVDFCFSQAGSNKIIYNEIDYGILPKLQGTMKSTSNHNIVNYFQNFKEKLKTIDKKLKNDQIDLQNVKN